MDFNLITNIETCHQFLKSVPLSLVYYSHIPSSFIAVIIGIFVLLKSKSLVGKALFSIAIIFSLWSSIDLLLWVGTDSRIYMFFWAIEYIFEVLLFAVSLYFIYLFIDKKDVDLKLKLIWGAMVAPIVILTVTKYTLTNFDISKCNPTEGPIWNSYIFPIEIIFFLWILIFSIVRYRKAQKESKGQIISLLTGVALFLGVFSGSGYLVNITGYDYNYELLGLIGVPIFLGVLAYLVVKYKAFDIKLLGAQALVSALVILIGSQFFFIQNNTNRILTGITLALAVVFGWVLVRSVKEEAQRKEELQKMADALAVSNDRLKKLDNAKTEFISIASHQLRTPLTVIKGYVSLIADGSYGPISKELAAVIGNVKISNDRLIALVEDLLNISRIESGRMEFDIKPVDVIELCTEIFNSFTFKAKDGNIDLGIELPQSEMANAVTDRNKLREVISNLTDNAIKYTPAGWVKIKAFQKDSETVRIEISDSGIGIPATEMPYLFAKFSRGKDTGRLNASGTGLGLHVGKKMIEALHGKIWAESEGDKKGSTFVIELPIKTEQK